MLIRTHTKASRVWTGLAGAVGTAGLSAALLSPPAYAGLLTSVLALAVLVLMRMSVKRQRVRTADLGLVSADERRAFLFWHTTWLVAGLACLVGALVLAFGSFSPMTRAALGHVFLLLGALAVYMAFRTSLDHAARVCRPD